MLHGNGTFKIDCIDPGALAGVYLITVEIVICVTIALVFVILVKIIIGILNMFYN